MTATLGAVDKVAISTAAIYGLKDDLHLVGQQYSWAGSILSLGVRNALADGVIFFNPVIGYCRYVAIHLPGSQAALRQIPVCMLIGLVNHGAPLAGIS